MVKNEENEDKFVHVHGKYDLQKVCDLVTMFYMHVLHN